MAVLNLKTIDAQFVITLNVLGDGLRRKNLPYERNSKVQKIDTSTRLLIVLRNTVQDNLILIYLTRFKSKYKKTTVGGSIRSK
jgi:hypothetical protein